MNIELEYIDNIDRYLDLINEGYNPLFQYRRFAIKFDLRIYIQDGLFGKSALGKGDTLIANQKYYEWCFKNKLQICEECCKPLKNYWAGFVSHIYTRGSSPEMAHDPRNSRLLCEDCHPLAEDDDTHSGMKIYSADQIIKEILRYEYYQKTEARIIRIT